MKQLRLLKTAVDFFVTRSTHEKLRAICLSVAVVFCTVSGIVWYVQMRSNELIIHINQLKNLRTKNNALLARFEILQEKEAAFMAHMQEQKDFSIKTYFERFIKEQNLTPEGNWAETEKRPIAGNDLLEEEILRASFKNMTTERIVGIFANLEKDSFVDVKEASLKRENALVTLDLVLAAKRFKKVIEES